MTKNSKIQECLGYCKKSYDACQTEDLIAFFKAYTEALMAYRGFLRIVEEDDTVRNFWVYKEVALNVSKKVSLVWDIWRDFPEGACRNELFLLACRLDNNAYKVWMRFYRRFPEYDKHKFDVTEYACRSLGDLRCYVFERDYEGYHNFSAELTDTLVDIHEYRNKILSGEIVHEDACSDAVERHSLDCLLRLNECLIEKRFDILEELPDEKYDEFKEYRYVNYDN